MGLFESTFENFISVKFLKTILRYIVFWLFGAQPPANVVFVFG